MKAAGQQHESVDLPKRTYPPVLKLAAAALLLVVLTGLLLHFWTVVSHGYKSLRLYAGHDVTTGVVTTDIIDSSSAYYEVEIDGTTYTGKTSKKFRKGEVIDVAYLPGSPNINRPKKSLWNDSVTFGVVIAALIFVLLFIVNGKYLSKKETHEK